MLEIAAAKKELRRRFSKKRNELAASNKDQWSQQACDYIIEYIKANDISTIMVYIPFRSEINTWPLIEWCWLHHIHVLVPRCDIATHTMELYLLESKDELIEGAFSILEPNPLLTKKSTDLPNIVIVPGLAFTAKGARLGYGGGYYDRYYSSVKQLSIEWLGIGYDIQLTDELPMQENDIWLTHVVTNRGIITSSSNERKEQ